MGTRSRCRCRDSTHEVYVLLSFLFSVSVARALDIAYSGHDVWNAVTVSPSGRVFVEYPRLDGSAGLSVAELSADGTAHAYPNEAWNSWMPGKDPAKYFVRTNAVRIGPDGALWVVDTGSPKFGAPRLVNGVKLVRVDLATNSVSRAYELGGVTSERSMIDDVRFTGDYAILSDAGDAALIVLDLKSGFVRRVLAGDASTSSRKPLLASGRELRDASGPVHIQVDQIEISPDGAWLYYQAAEGKMYRVPVAALTDASLSPSELRKKVEFWFDTPSTGGTAMDADGNIYLSDVNKRRLLKLSPSKKLDVIADDKRLDWADALWITDDGMLWTPVAQLDETAPFNGGVSKVKEPLVIMKLKIDHKPALH